MKWFSAFAKLPALVADVISALDAWETGQSNDLKRLRVIAAALDLREIIALFYAKTPSVVATRVICETALDAAGVK